jgi:hypothetical protein
MPWQHVLSLILIVCVPLFLAALAIVLLLNGREMRRPLQRQHDRVIPAQPRSFRAKR